MNKADKLKMLVQRRYEYREQVMKKLQNLPLMLWDKDKAATCHDDYLEKYLDAQIEHLAKELGRM